MPYFFASPKIAITQAFVGSAIAETAASNSGIGHLMMIASSNFDVPLVFAGLLILAGLSVLLFLIFAAIEAGQNPVLARITWRGQRHRASHAPV